MQDAVSGWGVLDGVLPDPAPTVSVVVAHYEQPHDLERTLEALRRQTHPADRLEIVVVDDGSRVPPRVPASVTLLRQDDRGFRLAAARNLGARAAIGDVLCFLDADCSPEPEFVAELTRLPALRRDVVTVGRRRHADLGGLPTDLPLTEIPSDRVLDEPAWLRTGYARSRNLLDADPRSYRYVIGAMIGCSRTFFAETGGFDESFTSYGGEDWDWAWRSWQAGAEFAHVPNAVAWHNGPDSGARTRDRRVTNDETRRLQARIPVHGARPHAVLGGPADITAALHGTWTASQTNHRRRQPAPSAPHHPHRGAGRDPAGARDRPPRHRPRRGRPLPPPDARSSARHTDSRPAGADGRGRRRGDRSDRDRRRARCAAAYWERSGRRSPTALGRRRADGPARPRRRPDPTCRGRRTQPRGVLRRLGLTNRNGRPGRARTPSSPRPSSHITRMSSSTDVRTRSVLPSQSQKRTTRRRTPRCAPGQHVTFGPARARARRRECGDALLDGHAVRSRNGPTVTPFVVWIAIAVVLVILLGMSLHIVAQDERGVVLRLGRVVATKQPGLAVIVPVIDRLTKVPMRIVLPAPLMSTIRELGTFLAKEAASTTALDALLHLPAAGEPQQEHRPPAFPAAA